MTALVLCHQIGSARAMAPAVAELARRRAAPAAVVIADAVALDGWAEYGVPAAAPAEFDIDAAAPDIEDAGRLLDMVAPDMVVTGTSAGLTLEKVVTRRARESGLPCLGVLDHWSNYALRFAGPTGPLHFFPDRLAIMDEVARADLMSYGCPAQQLVITGQPAFDGLRAEVQAVDRAALRASLGVGRGDTLVLFIAEPHSTDYGTGPDSPLFMGYTEFDAFEGLVTCCQSLVGAHRLRVAIKPHPTEAAGKWLRAADSRNNLLVWSDVSPRQAIAAADVVVGMTSMLLIEAALADRPAISYQPGLTQPEAFAGNRLGLTVAAASEQELLRALDCLSDENEGFRPGAGEHPLADGHATERLLDLLCSRW